MAAVAVAIPTTGCDEENTGKCLVAAQGVQPPDQASEQVVARSGDGDEAPAVSGVSAAPSTRCAPDGGTRSNKNIHCKRCATGGATVQGGGATIHQQRWHEAQ